MLFRSPRRGGKSKLQERLDKQAAKDGSTVKKTFLASATAMALVGGGYGYVALMNDGGLDLDLPGFGGARQDPAPIAMALPPTAPQLQAAAGAAAHTPFGTCRIRMRERTATLSGSSRSERLNRSSAGS